MGKSIDLTGKKFGKLVVIRKTEKRDQSGCIMWECRCDCGSTKNVSTNCLNKGTVKSCGCEQNRLEDLTGMRFGRLTVISLDRYDPKNHSTRWNCLCDCGTEKSVFASCLKSGGTTSCGCYSSEQKSKRSRTHGFGNENRLYRIWIGIKSRCYSKSNHNFERYGARGIFVCDDWRNSFETFREWALSSGYRDDLSIDREDNNGPYSPQNCRWATKKVQNNNRRTNVYITYNGETHTLSEWSEITGIKALTLASRKRAGWSDTECIEIPVKKSNNQTTRNPKKSDTSP